MRWIGEQYEKQAALYLTDKNLSLVEKNFHSRFGEIDLIMLEGKTLCFIEVKHRKSATFGSAAEMITPSKQSKIKKTALFYIQQHPKYNDYNLRFDAVLSQGEGKNNHLEWIKNAF